MVISSQLASPVPLRDRRGRLILYGFYGQFQDVVRHFFGRFVISVVVLRVAGPLAKSANTFQLLRASIFQMVLADGTLEAQHYRS